MSHSRPSDANPIFADDDETPLQTVEVVIGDKTCHDVQHRIGLLIIKMEHDHPWMRPGRIGAEVAESEVEGDEHPLLVLAYGKEIGIGRTDEILVVKPCAHRERA